MTTDVIVVAVYTPDWIIIELKDRLERGWKETLFTQLRVPVNAPSMAIVYDRASYLPISRPITVRQSQGDQTYVLQFSVCFSYHLFLT